MQQQAQQAVSKSEETNKDKAQFYLDQAKQEHAVIKDQINQFNLLKEKLVKMYQLQGFKQLVRQNPNMSRFYGVVRQDFQNEGQDDLISA